MLCQLCKREETLTGHHVIPKKEHGKVKHLNKYSKKELRSFKIYLCLPCHSQIHALFSEQTLADNYETIECLLANEDVQKWVKFIETKPIGFVPKVRRRWA